MTLRDLVQVVCDRCGKAETFPRNGEELPAEWHELGECHFCPACHSEFKQWLKAGKGPKRVK